MIQINVSNKAAFTLVFLFLIIVVGAIVIAYNSGSDPSYVGHSGEEIRVTVNGQQKLLNDALNDLSGANISFINPVIVRSETSNTVVPWTNFDASSYIPSGAKVVILEAEASMGNPNSGDVDAHIKIRKDSSSSEYVLLRGRSSGSSDWVSWASQGIFPISSSRTFQYSIESPGFDSGFTIKLIGYS